MVKNMAAQKKRWINYRPVVLLAAFQLAALLLGRYRPDLWYVGAIALVAAVALLLVKKKIFATLFLIPLVLAGFFIAKPPEIDAPPEFLNAERLAVTARIGDGIEFSNGGAAFTVDHAVVVTEGGAEWELGSLRVAADFTGEGDPLRFIEPGWRVELAGRLDVYRTASGEIVYALREAEIVNLYYGKPYFPAAVRLRAYKNLSAHMNPKSAGLCYALLFGDKTRLDGDAYGDFQFSGLAHALAVSGLHVNLLIAVFLYALSRLRLNRNAARLALLPFLGFYCVLCGFSPGVLRASLMFAAYAAARLFHKRYDSLNALGLASVIALTAFPDSAFQLSYQLSYLSALAAVSLTPVFLRVTEKRPLSHAPLKVRRAVCLTLAVQLMTLPLTLRLGFNPYAVLTNAAVLPLIVLHFYILVPAVFLSLLLPFLSFLLAVPDWTASGVLALTGLTARLPYAHITLIPVFWLCLLPVALLIVGKYVRPRMRWKAAAAAPLILAAIVALSVVNAPPPAEYSARLFSGGVYAETLVTDGETQVYIGKLDEFNVNALTRELYARRIRKLDAVFLTDAGNGAALKRFIDAFKPAAVFVPRHLEDARGDEIAAALAFPAQKAAAV
ncbi:MAG: ComEC/Rec2 family competence protein, partial [Clostridiales bacterium]|nr:ComEC/Rec2 family competence protein [Clostridiales bacterium]